MSGEKDGTNDDKPLEMPILKRPRRCQATDLIAAQKRLEPVEDRDQITRGTSPLKFAPRDPRFDPRCGGSSDARHFIRNYTFLNDVRRDELEKLGKALRTERDPVKVSKIRNTMNMIRNKMVELDNRQRQISTASSMQSSGSSSITPSSLNSSRSISTVPSEDRGSSSRGRHKQRTYVNKSDIKKQLMVDKFRELKESGKLTKYLERKRKKNLRRDERLFEAS